jgi:hypothetical protein
MPAFRGYVGEETDNTNGLSKAERDLIGGIQSGTVGIIANEYLHIFHESQGIDTTSRDYSAGKIIGAGLLGGISAGVAHLNTNLAKSNFGVYKIEIDGTLHKIGKADLDRITQSSGLPTRLHQQIRKLTKSNPDSVVTGEVIEVLPNSTSSAAKSVETRLLHRANASLFSFRIS